MGYTFNGASKIVSLTAGTTTLDLIDLWSRWKDWALAGNAGYPIALDTVGGEPIDPSAGTMIPLYLFLKNGWRIRPQEADHTLRVINGTLLVEGGGDPFVNTLGNYNVRVVYQQPVQAIGYSTTGTSGPSAGDIANAVLSAAQAAPIHADVKAGQSSIADAVWSKTLP